MVRPASAAHRAKQANFYRIQIMKSPAVKRISFSKAVIANPKRHAKPTPALVERIFPYYAGYSKTFAEQLLRSVAIGRNSLVLDPWNGSGTTTHAASQLGINSIGLDLNPVMVIVAKASLLPIQDSASLLPLALSLVEQSIVRNEHELSEDPLCEWLVPESALFVRQLEAEINRTLISHNQYTSLKTKETVNHISALGAFFYVGLFRTVRRILESFIPTNPTWIKRPANLQQRKRPSRKKFHESFVDEIRLLTKQIAGADNLLAEEISAPTIGLGNAEALSLPNASVDLIVTSPPYCTRIDYAVATAIELAVLRFDEQLHDQLRRSLMGTSTVKAKSGTVNSAWGGTCVRFLEAMYNHPSKASRSYYFKNHLQYFESLYISISELSRVLKPQGSCVLVVQDSFYKDVHNDVPAIVIEMASHVGMSIRRRDDFTANRSMVGLNRHAKTYYSIPNSMIS